MKHVYNPKTKMYECVLDEQFVIDDFRFNLNDDERKSELVKILNRLKSKPLSRKRNGLSLDDCARASLGENKYIAIKHAVKGIELTGHNNILDLDIEEMASRPLMEGLTLGEIAVTYLFATAFFSETCGKAKRYLEREGFELEGKTNIQHYLLRILLE